MAQTAGYIVFCWFLIACYGTGANGCDNIMATVSCGTTFADSTVNMTMQLADMQAVFCNNINEYKACLVNACGREEDIPGDILSGIDTTLDQYNINCDSGGDGHRCCPSLLMSFVACLVVFFFAG